MRLQRRLYEICLVSFLVGFLVGGNWLFSMLNHLANYQNTQLSSETKNQDSNCHIFRVLFFYSLILRGFKNKIVKQLNCYLVKIERSGGFKIGNKCSVCILAPSYSAQF